MQQHCDHKKKADEALKPCLQRKSVPHQILLIKFSQCLLKHKKNLIIKRIKLICLGSLKLSARWHHCITDERTGHMRSSERFSGSGGNTRKSHNSLAVCVRVGDSNSNQGVWTSVCKKTLRSSGVLFFYTEERSAHILKDKLSSLSKKGAI